MSACWGSLIGNRIVAPPARPFGAILGLSPSKGARSPSLWRAAFVELGISADFHPFDVTLDALPDVINSLRRDSRFVGGAVAVPYKQHLVELLDSVDADAAVIGAVNALRSLPDGGIAGANTDALAARQCLEEAIGPLRGRTVTCLGLGGVGKAVACALAAAGARVRVWNRTPGTAADFSAQRQAAGLPIAALVDIGEAIAGADVLVNCTSVGFRPNGSKNPDSPVRPDVFALLPPHAFVFDVIYQPAETALLRAARAAGHGTMNGLAMNRRQAVLAFCLAFPAVDPGIVAAAMGRVA